MKKNLLKKSQIFRYKLLLYIKQYINFMLIICPQLTLVSNCLRLVNAITVSYFYEWYSFKKMKVLSSYFSDWSLGTNVRASTQPFIGMNHVIQSIKICSLSDFKVFSIPICHEIVIKCRTKCPSFFLILEENYQHTTNEYV